MVGDMFNDALRGQGQQLVLRIGCSPGPTLLVRASVSYRLVVPGGLGAPSSSGSQNNIRYAYFSSARGAWRSRSMDGSRSMILSTTRSEGSRSSKVQEPRSRSRVKREWSMLRTYRLFPVAACGRPRAARQLSQPVLIPPVVHEGADVIVTLERLAELRQKGSTHRSRVRCQEGGTAGQIVNFPERKFDN